MMNISKVDSCIAFLGNTPSVDWKAVASRLKPGSHIAAICPTLQQHRVTAAMEESGVEIRDSLLFLGQPSYITAMGRVPLEGTVAENVLRHGVGAINVDECRVKAKENDLYFNRSLFQGRYEKKGLTSYGGLANWKNGDNSMPNSEGRWPANVIVQDDENIKAAFPKTNKQAICKSDDKSGWQTDYVGGRVSKAVSRKLYLDDENGGSASRFFHNITEENKLQGLVAYLHKLITPPGGKVLVYNIPTDAIMGLDIAVYNGI
jgi:hypothetical protein